MNSESDCEINDHKSENETENDSQNDHESTDEEEIERKRNEKCKRKQERRDRRASMEQKLDTLSNTLEVMRGLMQEKGILGDSSSSGKSKKVRGKNRDSNHSASDEESETTIYHNAVL